MMKKLFQYDLTGRMQSELCALDVFSTDWDGTIYHWRKNQFRIDLFKKFWGGFTLRYDGEDGKPNYLRVSKKIHDYDQLVDLLQRKMKESV